MVKNLPAMQETQVQSLGREDPWRREWQPTPVFLPEESPRQTSLTGCSQWGCKESDTTKQLSTAQYNTKSMKNSDHNSLPQTRSKNKQVKGEDVSGVTEIPAKTLSPGLEQNQKGYV